MGQQQADVPRVTARVRGKFASGYRQTMTESIQSRFWPTPEGLAALAAAEAADEPRLRTVPTGGRS